MTFKGYRHKQDGSTQEVIIEVEDSGPKYGLARYNCRATADDGKTAYGNPAERPKYAIDIVHWKDLDL